MFEDGKPRTGEYRRFRIKSVEGANDFASHQEVLRRRFRRAAVAEEGSAEELRWRLPDLVIVDGGKGQVSAAAEVFAELGLDDIALAGLAKEREELFLPGQSEPILLPPDVGRALPRPAPARRGPPVRDHLPPRPARQGLGPLRLRRPARGRPQAQAGAPPGLRFDEADPRGTGRADRRRARDRAGAGDPDQDCAGGLGPAVLLLSGAMRRAGPFLILIIGIAALVLNFWPGLRLPSFSGSAAATGSSRRSWASISRAASGSSTRRCPTTASRPNADAMNTIKDIIERRVNGIGVSEPQVVTQGADRVVVELPGATDEEAITDLVGQTGLLEFIPLPAATYGTASTNSTGGPTGRHPGPAAAE